MFSQNRKDRREQNKCSVWTLGLSSVVNDVAHTA